MTAKEAVDILRRGSTFAYDEVNAEEFCRAYDMAVDALENQIPKKPMISIDAYNQNLWHLYCPTCGSWVGMHNRRLKGTDMHNNTNSEICAKCGQMFELKFEEGE